jgi:hypothetical protein
VADRRVSAAHASANARLSAARRGAHHRRVLRPARLSALLLAVACGDDDPAAATTAATTGEPATTASTSSSTSAAPPTTGLDPAGTSTGDLDVTTGAPGPVCPERPPLATSALGFDGDDGVTMGVAPDLGLDDFTLAAWVRRDGPGRTAGTGVGGLRLVPLIAKGRGEDDGSNVDCNYAFGFHGDVLGADFEDMAAGDNHPVYGKTAVPLGEWHHVAATYDGATWRLYLDGVLDAELVADATPRHDSIQHFGLGAAYDSLGEPAGGLHGALDEVRVYARALTAEELQVGMYSASPDLLGLVGHWRLDAADGDARDLVGDAPGTISGAAFTAPGAVLDRGAAAVLTDPRGEDGALLVDVADPEGDPVAVEFFARELTAADDFTVVVLPDTQYYTRDADPPGRPDPDDTSYFTAQTQWALDHRVDRNVVGLFGLGDIINNSDQPKQWQRASQAYALLEAAIEPDLPHGLPFGVGFGNHDQLPKDEPGATAVANDHFGPDRFAGRPYYGGNFDGDNDENFVVFRAGGLDIVVVSFQFDPNPDPEVLAWARGVLLSRPRALGVVATHYIVTGGGDFSDQGQAIYDALADVPNLQLMASGHVAQAARRTDESAGNVIHSMLSDYQRSAPDPNDPEQPIVVEQSLTNGGHGYMRIWNFQPSRQKLFVESYSPRLDAAYTDEQNEFELDVDLVGAGRGPLVSLGVVAPVDGTARVDLPDAAPGAVFEWYAVARDCAHATTLPLQPPARP